MNNQTVKLLILSIVFSSGCHDPNKNDEFHWSTEKEKIHNNHRNDTTKVSTINWEADTKNIRLHDRPMVNGAFPVPRYELADSSFVGLGNYGKWNGIKLESKTLICHSLYLTKSDVNKKFIPNKSDEVFFTIVGLTDFIDSENYTHTSVNISSRNHPHYVGEGFIKTKSNEIDFIAFLTADRNEYAIVNMRLFDLRIGRTVLIAPKKDGTFRSLQLESPILSSAEIDEYIENLKKNNQVVEFFTKPDNI